MITLFYDYIAEIVVFFLQERLNRAEVLVGNEPEHRCPPQNFAILGFHSPKSGTKASLRVLAGELGEMPVKKPLFNSQSDHRVVRLRFDFLDDSAQFESVAARDWFQHVTCRHA